MQIYFLAVVSKWHCFSLSYSMKNDKNKVSLKGDIHDSKKDEEKLQPEETILDLPDVKDIPGQENIHPPKLREYADVTISSDGEEGKGILDDGDDDETDGTNVTPEERALLEQTADSMASEDDLDRIKATLDNTDEDGEPLNEQVDASGEDLDVPGSEDDDDDEELGEEDEENNSYSLGADKD
jgi:hypothetical protein